MKEKNTTNITNVKLNIAQTNNILIRLKENMLKFETFVTTYKTKVGFLKPDITADSPPPTPWANGTKD